MEWRGLKPTEFKLSNRVYFSAIAFKDNGKWVIYNPIPNNIREELKKARFTLE